MYSRKSEAEVKGSVCLTYLYVTAGPTIRKMFYFYITANLDIDKVQSRTGLHLCSALSYRTVCYYPLSSLNVIADAFVFMACLVGYPIFGFLFCIWQFGFSLLVHTFSFSSISLFVPLFSFSIFAEKKDILFRNRYTLYSGSYFFSVVYCSP